MGNIRLRPAMHVYVIAVLPDGPVKIGRAVNPRVRLDQIQTGNHCALTLAASCELSYAAAMGVEKHLQRVFVDQHIRGEWFNITPDEAVAALRRHGTVVISPKHFMPQQRPGADPMTALLDAQLSHPRLRQP